MPFIKSVLLLFFLFLLCLNGHSQNRDFYRIMFYNVENLFDTIDNPETNDEEFLPDGNKHWDNFRYWRKINKLYQVIAAAGQESAPDIIGLCEVESFLPLYNLIYHTPLLKYNYTIIHKDSPDRRGIDVALLIRNDKVKLLYESFIHVDFPYNPAKKTRDILFAQLLIEEDTLNVFVNHWPSRWGGEVKSEPNRLRTSNILSGVIDSIFANHSNAKIIAMGDFKDEPKNKSMKQLVSKREMVNLSELLQNSCKCGTYKYKSEWNMIDQMLVSESMLERKGLYTSDDAHSVFNPGFLLVDDISFGGLKPCRTYHGPLYKGGYSDHLPIILDLKNELPRRKQTGHQMEFHFSDPRVGELDP